MSKFVDATLRLIDKFSSPLNKAVSNMQARSRQIQKTGRSIQSTGRSLSSVGSALTRNVTVPIVGIMTASGKMTDTFQRNMGNVNTLLDNHDHLEGYKNTAVKVSNDTGLGLDTVSKGIYQVISSIGDGGKETEKIFNVMAKGAKGGGAEVSQSVSLISAAMKGYDSISEKTAKKVSDLSFQTQKLGVTTYKELAESMQPLFPLGNSLNVSYEELFGSMATLTGVTGNTAEVTTQMKGVFTGLLKPTESMQKLMQKYGYQNGQAMIKSKGMSGVLSILKKETGGQSDKMAKLFGNSRALTAALALTGSQYDTFNEKTKKLNKSSGSTEKALKDMQTPMSKIRKTVNILKNSMTVFGESVLSVVVPPITKFGDKVKGLAERFSKLSPSTKEFIVKTALIAAAVGPAIKIIAMMTTGIGGLVVKFGKLSQKFKGASSFGAFLGPGGKIVLILGAIAVAAVLVYKNWDKITAGVRKMQKAVVKAMNAAGLDTKKLGKTVKSIASMAGKAFGSIGSAGKKIIKVLKPVATFIGGVFKVLIRAGLKLVVGYFSGWLKSTVDVVHGVTKAFSGVTDFISGVFSGNWKKAWGGVKKIFSGVFEALTGIAKRPLNGIIGLVNTVIGGLNKLKIKIPSWVPGKYGGKSFGVNIPKIPMLAKGTGNWMGGIAQVHEKGGEIIDLPRGSRVYPHDKSVQMAKASGSRSVSITIQKIADKMDIRTVDEAKEMALIVAKEIATQLEKIEPNMA